MRRHLSTVVRNKKITIGTSEVSKNSKGVL
jgi:hypothetical protein